MHPFTLKETTSLWAGFIVSTGFSDYCQTVVCCAWSLIGRERRYKLLQFCGCKQFTGWHEPSPVGSELILHRLCFLSVPPHYSISVGRALRSSSGSYSRLLLCCQENIIVLWLFPIGHNQRADIDSLILQKQKDTSLELITCTLKVNPPK